MKNCRCKYLYDGLLPLIEAQKKIEELEAELENQRKAYAYLVKYTTGQLK